MLGREVLDSYFKTAVTEKLNFPQPGTTSKYFMSFNGEGRDRIRMEKEYKVSEKLTRCCRTS